MAKHILIVDDEREITGNIRRRLEDQGYECDEAWDGGSALDKIGAGSYHLVLMDYSMPVMKGDEVCQTVRENEKLKDLPIIVFTAYSNKDVDFFRENGATDVVYKPIEDEVLMEMVRRYAPND